MAPISAPGLYKRLPSEALRRGYPIIEPSGAFLTTRKVTVVQRMASCVNWDSPEKCPCGSVGLTWRSEAMFRARKLLFRSIWIHLGPVSVLETSSRPR